MYLIVDDRERALTDRGDSLFQGIQWKVARLEVGDYAISTSGGRIIAIIERKTIADYLASLTDGRHENRHKMLTAQKEINDALPTADSLPTKVFYIVEGTRMPKRTRFTKEALEGSIYRLMFRDGIHVVRTTSKEDTAAKLVGMMKAVAKLEYRSGGNDQDALFKKTPKTDYDIMMSIWRAVPQIGVARAALLVTRYTLREYILLADPGAEVTLAEATPALPADPDNGRPTATPARKAQTLVIKPYSRQTALKNILKYIPGIGATTLANLSSCLTSIWDNVLLGDVEAIANLRMNNHKRIGNSKAKNIVKYFTWKADGGSGN